MKRPSYKHAIEIIALNDEPTETDLEEIKRQISVCLISDIFEVSEEKVALDILNFRKKHGQ